MIDSEARQRLLEYLRFQQEMGVDAVRIDVQRLGVKAEPQAGRTPARPAVASPAMAAQPSAAVVGHAPAPEPSRMPSPAAPARTLRDLAPAPTFDMPSRKVSAPSPSHSPAPSAVTPASWPEDAATNDVTASDAAARLRIIQDEIGPDCTRCKLHTLGRKQVVFGVGNPQAELVFVGEGPGADEDEQGIPFVGRAGKLLTDMIEKGMGLRRDEVYICNVVKCRPPGNRTPEADECETCAPFMRRQIRAIRPRMVCALGAVAAQNLMPYKGSLASVRGRIHEIDVAGYATKLVVTYHPAYLLRDPSQKKEAWKDLQMIMKELGIPVPRG